MPTKESLERAKALQLEYMQAPCCLHEGDLPCRKLTRMIAEALDEARGPVASPEEIDAALDEYAATIENMRREFRKRPPSFSQRVRRILRLTNPERKQSQ